jgi:hypothetical protein
MHDLETHMTIQAVFSSEMADIDDYEGWHPYTAGGEYSGLNGRGQIRLVYALGSCIQLMISLSSYTVLVQRLLLSRSSFRRTRTGA